MNAPDQPEMLSNEDSSSAAPQKMGVDQGPKSDSEDEEDESESGKEVASSDKGTDMDNLNRLRREKRLAMNRVSARERRKRKKMLIATLESRVSDLTKSNEKFKSENEQLVLRVRGLTERLASQEEELVFLRALVAKIPDSQLMQHLASRGSAAAAGAVPSLSTGATSGAPDLSLRRLLSSQGVDPASTATISAVGSLGNRPPGVPYGVSPNSAIEQDILGRIGGQPSDQILYHQMLSRHTSPQAYSSGINAAFPNQNTLRVPAPQALGVPPPMSMQHSPLLSASSESSRAASQSQGSLASSTDARTAFLLQQLLQERQQKAESRRFLS